MQPQIEKEAFYLLNNGTELELTQVTGIGQKTAEKIIVLRKETGLIESIDGAKALGITQSKFKKITEWLISIKIK